MAKTFYYDSVGLLESDVKAGTFSGTSFTVAESAVTDEDNINDQSISNLVTSFDANDTIRIDLGSAKAVNFVLQYNTSLDGNDLWYYQSTSATSSLEKIGELNTSPIGWNLTEWSATTKEYWFLRSEDGIYAGLSEVIIGSKLTFENEPDIGISTQEKFATQINKSYGGSEYAIKKHDPQTTWMLNFSNISQTFKDNLVSLESAVTDYKKFVYHDGSAYNYVRLDSSIKFTEVAFQRYSASIKLREQLS